ncbi:cyclic AMP-dependent transcription factor ATF-3 isoform X6 [Mirounga angustirostris]|uniref:cyclic AMP-dependent transcription factor ATF-3 isoform X6 n=1 Tax=Mirounga angustirostris TaxID=9716 RepID=UPI00313CCBC0
MQWWLEDLRVQVLATFWAFPSWIKDGSVSSLLNCCDHCLWSRGSIIIIALSGTGQCKVAPEEDERKKRRRERNKIAAAKCRNKKKEKTECLQKESEKLESVNAELKAQIEELKNEKQHLIYMLNLHRPTCIVRAQNGRTPEDERNLFIQQIKEGTLQS